MAKEEMCHYKRHNFRKDSPVFSLLATSNKSFLLLPSQKKYTQLLYEGLVKINYIYI